MSKTDIVPALQGFTEDWSRQISKRQLHTMKCGKSCGGHGVGAGGHVGHLAQIWGTREILEAVISKSKLRSEKWGKMAKRRSLEVRVFFCKGNSSKKFWGWETVCACEKPKCWGVSPRGSVCKMSPMLSLLFLELFDPLPFYPPIPS